MKTVLHEEKWLVELTTQALTQVLFLEAAVVLCQAAEVLSVRFPAASHKILKHVYSGVEI